MAIRRKCPTFFKFLRDSSLPHLPLPPDFVRLHLENQMPKDPMIRCATGERSWRLKIKKIDELYGFSDGWSNVVRDFQLDSGDFLVFKFVSKSIFEITAVFSPKGCEKDLPANIQVVEDVDDDFDVHEVEDDDEVDDDDDDYEEDKEDREAKVTKIQTPAKKQQPSGRIPATEVVKRKRRRPERNSIEAPATKAEIRQTEIPAIQPQLTGKTPATETVKKKRGRPRKSSGEIPVAKVEKRQSEFPEMQPQPSGRNPVTEVMKRKNGRLKQNSGEVPAGDGVEVKIED